MDATRTNNAASSSNDVVDPNESTTTTTDQRRFRGFGDFASAFAILGRAPLQQFGRLTPAQATAPASEITPLAVNRIQVDELPPPLASDSDSSDSNPDASDDSDSDGGSDGGSLPSLQTVSDSSEEEPDMYDTDSDGSGWDERDARDDIRRGMETVGDSAGSTAFYEPPLYSDEDDWEDEDEDEDDDEDEEDLYDHIAAQGEEIPLRSIDLLEWLMTPRRLTVDNDPQRAETLLAGLEAASDKLVRRYEKLRGRDGETAEGCAICRDDYLIEHSRDPSDFHRLTGADLTGALFELLPFHPSPHQILVFPCPGRHLFHRSCLAPWLARKTTCPSCRFDIDPDSLTLRLTGATSHYAAGARRWEPPAVPGLEEWLVKEERYQVDGHRAESAHTAKPDATGHAGPRVTFANSDGDDEFASDSDEEDAAPRRAPPRMTLASRLADDASHSQSWSAVAASHRRSPSSSRHAFSRGPGVSHAPPHGPSRNTHDAVVESLITRILRLERTIGRANTGLHSHSHSHLHSHPHSPPPIVPELLPETTGASDDDLPPLVE
ncbi:hypothetical protein DAEQUDRAFT_759119 [Daedalea quercina L-15889]|uniref:RING-type domain-containing protein n=1 Tax=Daedalea quercina L-15889 TaxID=1314783 RepID=A0A165MKV7_9APHY|nr:hypothetical protein DAEQUDRAFT_759119 [Daedalea quercina L-15889]